MAAYGRYTGGQHFTYLKRKKVDTSKSSKPLITEEQINILSQFGYAFQPKSMTAERATKLIETLSKKNVK